MSVVDAWLAFRRFRVKDKHRSLTSFQEILALQLLTNTIEPWGTSCKTHNDHAKVRRSLTSFQEILALQLTIEPWGTSCKTHNDQAKVRKSLKHKQAIYKPMPLDESQYGKNQKEKLQADLGEQRKKLSREVQQPPNVSGARTKKGPKNIAAVWTPAQRCSCERVLFAMQCRAPAL